MAAAEARSSAASSAAPRQPRCRRCGAGLSSRREYCSNCGERWYPIPNWRRPLIAAAIVLIASAVLFAIVYAKLSSNAHNEVKSGAAGAQSKAAIVATTDAARAPGS